MSIVNEEWRDVLGFEGFYQVSNLGRVRSVDRVIDAGLGRKKFIPSRMVTQKLRAEGYLFVSLSKDGIQRYPSVHRLVAIAFVDGYFEGAQVNHIDGDRTNNVAANLEFCTGLENVRHAHSLGLCPSAAGELNGRAVLTELDVKQIRVMLSQKVKLVVIARKFGVSSTAISRIRDARAWAHLP